MLAGPDQARSRRPEPVDLVARRAETRALAGKLGSPQPLLEMQLLLACSSPARGRAAELLHALQSCFDAMAGENHLRAAGLRVPGVAFLGADLPGVRQRFDRRLASGRFAPARRQYVTPAEIAGLLKPPSVHCAAPNVQRSGGRIDPPPPGLPTFDHQPDLIPLGTVAGRDGTQRLAGVRTEETFFAYMAGRSRWGKTETAIGQFVHLARAGEGGLFLDPHADALREIKTFLTAPEIAGRVIEIDLSDLAGRHGQPGWNLFAAHGRPAWESSERVEAVADAFAAALGWDERNTRALNLASQAAQALVELSRTLPPELAPTLFQLSTLLSDERWRTIVLPHVTPPTRAFFIDRVPAPDAGGDHAGHQPGRPAAGRAAGRRAAGQPGLLDRLRRRDGRRPDRARLPRLGRHPRPAAGRVRALRGAAPPQGPRPAARRSPPPVLALHGRAADL